MLSSPSGEPHDENNGNSQDDLLLHCYENLDRNSPDLWPEKLPGFRDFVSNSPKMFDKDVPDWLKGLDQDDMDLFWNLGKLSPNQMFTKIKELYNLAFELSIDEEREITRGKFLDVLKIK